MRGTADRPIIFSAPMILALLAGRKTMTRRLATSPLAKCQIGDRLWVRESLRAKNMDFLGMLGLTEPLTAPDPTRCDLCTSYAADGEPCVEEHSFDLSWMWRRLSVPSIHMPRPFSRLTLTVTDVKVERLQDISEGDARAEGATRFDDIPLDPLHRQFPSHADRWAMETPRTTGDCLGSARMAFGNFWLKLHGPTSWAENPTVVALTFTVTHRNIDAWTPQPPSPMPSPPRRAMAVGARREGDWLMAENTGIEWADHTWNPWFGCSKVSPACDHCYAEELMDHRYQRVVWGGDRHRTGHSTWNDPLRWDRAAAKAGKPATVFCLSLGDIWDNDVDPRWRRDAFAVMEKTPHLTYLLLSKRIGNAERMCSAEAANPCLPPNAAIGATMINQPEWDRDIDKLLHAGEVLGARFTFASVEPMLGPIETRGRLPNWVICGGESGRQARPMRPDWARSLRDQCQAAGVSFFFKQWGEFRPHDGSPSDEKLECDRESVDWPDGKQSIRVGKKAAGRLLDGRVHDEMPHAR